MGPQDDDEDDAGRTAATTNAAGPQATIPDGNNGKAPWSGPGMAARAMAGGQSGGGAPPAGPTAPWMAQSAQAPAAVANPMNPALGATQGAQPSWMQPGQQQVGPNWGALAQRFGAAPQPQVAMPAGPMAAQGGMPRPMVPSDVSPPMGGPIQPRPMGAPPGVPGGMPGALPPGIAQQVAAHLAQRNQMMQHRQQGAAPGQGAPWQGRR